MSHDDASYRRWYRELHHGAEPYARRVADPPKHRAEFELGRLESVTYQMPVGDRRPIRYKHDFNDAAMPLLLSTERGKLVVREGRYTVTQHGITDTDGEGKMTMQYYSAHPRYRRQEPEQNPFELFSERVPEQTGSGLVKAGAVAGTAAVVGGYATARWLPRMSLGWRGILQGGVGVLSGLALRSAAPNAATGLVCYGIVAAAAGVTAEVRINQAISRAMTPSTTTQTQQTQQTTATNGASTAGAALGQTAPAQGLPAYGRYDFRRVA